MYLATKDGSSCRIPERKAEYYKSMGYSLESLEQEVRTGTSSPKEKKNKKKDSATQEGVNPANS
jgi:hypothetical protein